jgi:hypothetical protein
MEDVYRVCGKDANKDANIALVVATVSRICTSMKMPT